MKTFRRICIKDFTVVDGDKSFTVERGKEYLTSAIDSAPVVGGVKPKKDCVTVFSKYWLTVPIDNFAGEQQYTK